MGGTNPVRLEGRAGTLRHQQPEDGDQAETSSVTQARTAAETALRTFLAGFGIGPGRDGDRLARQLLPGASALWQADPGEDPGGCALAHAEQAFEVWLTALLGDERLAGQQALPLGRAAFLACDGPGRWAGLLLTDDPLPEEFVAAMRAATPVLVPIPAPGAMGAQSLDAWTVADARRAIATALDANAVWFGYARPLITVPIKLDRSTS